MFSRQRQRQQAASWLVWCLVALLPCLGLGIAQRQTLGPLHVHAAPAAEPGRSSASVVQAALAWWWAQVQAQVDARQHAHAHARGLAHPHAHSYAHPQAHGQAHGPAQPGPQRAASAGAVSSAATAHSHAAWQRHHHDGRDASVIALAPAGDALDAQVAAASLLLPVLGVPAAGLRLAAGLALRQAWPRAAVARFSSWGMAPPLKPPRG